MRDINQFSGDNLGGNIRFEFAEINDIDSIAESIDGNITEKVILKDGKQWYCGYATQQSIGYTETTEDSAAGILYKRSLVAFCPKDNSDNKDLFYEMRNKKFIVKCTNSNGIKLLIGSIQEPLKFSAALASKTQIAELAGYSITFYGDGTLPAMVYDI